MPPPESAAKPPEPEPYQCPSCEGRDPVLMKVLIHMESAHPKPWRDLIRYPPIAGEVY